MINQRLIKKRLLSIKNIKKISKALEMVSASKVQKAQELAKNSKPFAEKIYDLVHTIDVAELQKDIPLLRTKGLTGNRLFVVVTTDKGLCGSINNNLLRLLMTDLAKYKGGKNFFITVGKKGQPFCLTHGELLADYSSYSPADNPITQITQNIVDEFQGLKVDDVFTYYTDFVTAIEQVAKSKKILPFTESESFIKEAIGNTGAIKKVNYNYEPGAKELLEEVLPFYIESIIRDVLYEALASEHSARMMAMKNATDNAENLSYTLELEYNKSRQQQITNEIAEIVTAKMTI